MATHHWIERLAARSAAGDQSAPDAGFGDTATSGLAREGETLPQWASSPRTSDKRGPLASHGECDWAVGHSDALWTIMVAMSTSGEPAFRGAWYERWPAAVMMFASGIIGIAIAIAATPQQQPVGWRINDAPPSVFCLALGLFCLFIAVRIVIGGVRITTESIKLRYVFRTRIVALDAVDAFVIGHGFLNNGSTGALRLRDGTELRVPLTGGASGREGNRLLRRTVDELNAELVERRVP